MFCFHDWHNHKSTDTSFRAEAFIHDLDSPLPGIMIMGTGLLYAFVGALVMDHILGFLVFGSAATTLAGVWAFRHWRDKSDPWGSSDRTCLKCGKVQFNCTKAEEKKEAKEKRKEAAEIRRNELSSVADEAFEKKAKLRRMAKA